MRVTAEGILYYSFSFNVKLVFTKIQINSLYIKIQIPFITIVMSVGMYKVGERLVIESTCLIQPWCIHSIPQCAAFYFQYMSHLSGLYSVFTQLRQRPRVNAVYQNWCRHNFTKNEVWYLSRLYCLAHDELCHTWADTYVTYHSHDDHSHSLYHIEKDNVLK